MRERPIPVAPAAKPLLDAEARGRLLRLRSVLADVSPWTEARLEESVRVFTTDEGVQLGRVAQPLRAAMTGAKVSPGIFEVMAVLGREEVLGRLDDLAGGPQDG